MASGLGFWLNNRARLTTSYAVSYSYSRARPPVPLVPLVAGRPLSLLAQPSSGRHRVVCAHGCLIRSHLRREPLDVELAP
jgi:hypothetical protein